MSVARIPEWRPKAWDDIEGHAVSVGSAGQKFLDRINDTVELLWSDETIAFATYPFCHRFVRPPTSLIDSDVINEE